MSENRNFDVCTPGRHLLYYKNNSAQVSCNLSISKRKGKLESYRKRAGKIIHKGCSRIPPPSSRCSTTKKRWLNSNTFCIDLYKIRRLRGSHSWKSSYKVCKTMFHINIYKRNICQRYDGLNKETYLYKQQSNMILH